jgi:hypothetical protein
MLKVKQKKVKQKSFKKVKQVLSEIAKANKQHL